MTLIKAHTSIIGETGYNCHARNFFKALNRHVPDSVRNWTVGDSWQGYHNDSPHDGEYYMDDELRTMLDLQTLTGPDSQRFDAPLYSEYPQSGAADHINIILNDNNHCYFREEYAGPTVAYNVWETTRQPDEFFDQLKRMTQVWVPSQWQAACTVEQGIPAHKVKVVPEGVDSKMFFPRTREILSPTGRTFRFVLIGRWEYRKSTREIIQAFVKTFGEHEPVELIINVDNPFATDGLSSTEQRLEKFGIQHSGIKIMHHMTKSEYIDLLNSADVFVSCARSEGWNLPLIEAMASGIPSIYSDWGAQLEFAAGKGIPVKILGEVAAGVQNEESWNPNVPGNFAEPDFADLSLKLRDSYQNFESHKQRALIESDEIREIFSWENAAKIALDHIREIKDLDQMEYLSDFAWVTCGNEKYMPLIQKLASSLQLFSKRKLIVYGIDCEVPDMGPNVIGRTMTVPYHSEHDRWYWKQYACLDSLNEDFENFIWIDGDVIANHNIDNITTYFSLLDNYPIPDSHVQEEFIGWYTEADGTTGTQRFIENICKKEGLGRLPVFAHVCLYLYNKKCDWWFNEILDTYKKTPLTEYFKYFQWNDEAIDNYLRSKYNFRTFLPVSNFDVSAWDGELMGSSGKAMEHFIRFWREEGPKNFGQIYGWQRIPKDKSNILYFHGNKNLDFAQTMTDYIQFQKNGTFHDSKYFFVSENEIKNLGKIHGIPGSTMDIAHQYGWDHAIYHEIYNLADYTHPRNEPNPIVSVRPGDVVVDLGGNIGIFTRYAHQMGASKIITFEPDRRYFKVLKQNAPASAILFNAAIGDALGKLRLTESSHLGGSNLWHPADPTQTQYEVNVYTLNYLLDNGLIDKIDFLKVDIEGSEIIALEGISDAHLLNIRNIAVEYHHEHLKFDDALRNKFVTRLNKLGFNSYTVLCGYNDALQLIYFWK